MTCSKIFSGDLPELTEVIIQYFRKDISTLYSCILINRLWCRLAIPLLWEDPFPKKDPFSREYLENQHFIEIYLSKLNEDVKTKLYEYGVNNNLISSNTLLFNYPSFIKYLNIDEIFSSIRTWVDTVVDLILQNPNLTYNIRNLTFRIHGYNPQNIIKLLKFLYSNCNSILSMGLNFPLYDIIRDRPLIEKCLTKIINSQHNLKKISFDLGQVLPPKLEYLNLYLSFNNTSDLEIFLKNSQNTFIKKLLIRNIVVNEDENINNINILFYIKKYIMKKERVKYLAINSDNDDYELFSLKDEVNEFKLYNIIVKKFSDLNFSSYSFINNFNE
ncbi:uncharacterized protein OCT59_020963 [Rhizophagus irregularis]|uniref:uncharacterized protein n=1 Tax=Rhizophagus irregularis TaxID=588596 RepID=UPI003322BB7D|nr:hypothetical protein OCT59_020963 [Rhizophagus irregularis]